MCHAAVTFELVILHNINLGASMLDVLPASSFGCVESHISDEPRYVLRLTGGAEVA
jgi:hypothetical protein